MAKNNETVEFINYHALIVTTIFGLFGGALANFLEIPELKLRYISMASLLGLVLILLIKLLLKVRNKVSAKQIMKIVSLLFFVFLLVSFYMFDKRFQETTFKYTDAYDSTGRYIKGDKKDLQPAAKFFIEQEIKKSGLIPSDQDLLDNFGGILVAENINNVTKVWIPDSITANTRKLITSYIIMAMLFIANIYFLTEVLLRFFKTKKKTKPQPAVG